MSEVPPYAFSSDLPCHWLQRSVDVVIRGYLVHTKHPPLGPYSRHSVGPYGGPRGGAVSYERSTPAFITRRARMIARSVESDL